VSGAAPRGRGVLLVLAGTSGAGKGTIGKRLRELEPDLVWSVSWVTRRPREGEVPEVDYHFVTREEFERERDAGGFLEWFEVYGDLYGTPRAPVVSALEAGRDVLLEIDVQGALAVREALPEAVLVFVTAPSREEQRRRLLRRGQDDPDAMARRLAQAEAEEAVAQERFDAIVVNDTVEQALRAVAAILRDHRAAAS
jgi:guanylate kinase